LAVLGEPGYTQYDLHFEWMGVRVRVHPWFWIISIVFGASSAGGEMNVGVAMVIWVGAMFMSILIHEMGHAMMMRRAGMDPHIVLYAMGGLAIPGGQDAGFAPYKQWRPQEQGRRSTFNWEKIWISFAGPGVQFVLAGFVAVLVYVGGGHLVYHWPIWIGVEGIPNVYLTHLFRVYLWINVIWAMVNLLPVFPLDGGQIAREIFIGFDSWNGVRRSLWLSVFTGAALAIGGLSIGSLFMALLFGSLAFSSFQALQMMGPR